ncbi:hypothetical protein DPMN_049485 [Dreissena polymorpha]|uniref:Endonuclease/exonuclease/phosphatase domain-containing protein n=1 Tax=Dreissena polymorpha TaxID=45954 RepID=A0A9D4CFG0_DREPO|nr:hypothetical protein DPMN_049485 [Dreissena polymorpha]
MTAIPYLFKELNTKRISICGISEHLLLDNNANILNSIDTNYRLSTITCANPAYANGRDFGGGGVAIMRHKDLDNLVEIVDKYSDRIASIRICCCSQFSYYKFTSRQLITTLAASKAQWTELWDICTVHTESNYILIMGDFNARFPRSDVITHLRSRDMYVTELAKSLHLYVATDTVSCTGPPFTFYP